MSDKKAVQLDRAMTFAGVNYDPGISEMPAAAAAYAEKRKFGKVVGENDSSTESQSDFEPLPLKETLERASSGDWADEVLDSLKAYRDVVSVGRKSGKTLSEIVEELEKSSETDEGKIEGDGKTEGGLPEDFPMKHVFEKSGFKSVEEIQAKSREELIAIDGIAEKTADKVLAYGK